MKKATREELFHTIVNAVTCINGILQKNAGTIDAELDETKRKNNL